MQVASGHYFFPPSPLPAEDQEPVKFSEVYSANGFFPRGPRAAEPWLFLSQIKHSGNKVSPFPRSRRAWCTSNTAATRVHARRTPTRSQRAIVTHAAGSSALERLRPLHRNPRNTRLAWPTYLLATAYRSDHSNALRFSVFFISFDDARFAYLSMVEAWSLQRFLASPLLSPVSLSYPFLG